MKAVAWAVVVFLLVGFGSLLGTAMLAAVVFAPAAQSEIEAQQCTGPIATTGKWQAPIAGKYVVNERGFGREFHPIKKKWTPHEGQDMSGQPGPGKIVAAADGTVTFAGTQGGYGNLVEIKHADGISSRYGHLASMTVKKGQKVTAGTHIGTEGTTGGSTGIHLHFEIRKDGTAIDPVPWMKKHGAPLNGKATHRSDPQNGAKAVAAGSFDDGEGGLGFDLPAAGKPRYEAERNPVQPIPPETKKLYTAAGKKYGLPWTLLAGIGMAETNHGRNAGISSAGARGLMQFLPSTFRAMAVDGDGDGKKQMSSDADIVYTAARYLVHEGATRGPGGVKEALYAYNHSESYGNSVLAYAAEYGGGTVLGSPADCDPGSGQGSRNVPPLASDRVKKVLTFAAKQDGKPYVMGAEGPDAWDCSSLTQQSFSQIGVTMPRTAQAQRDWLAQGNGRRIQPGHEKPGDLIFWDSYLGPDRIGHVVMVWDPSTKTTIDARGSEQGVGHFSYGDAQQERHIFEIWRVGNVKPEKA